jgi:hypothetical protein
MEMEGEGCCLVEENRDTQKKRIKPPLMRSCLREHTLAEVEISAVERDSEADAACSAVDSIDLLDCPRRLSKRRLANACA